MAKVTLINGGFETQLRKYVGSGFEGHPLWICRYLRENPGACRQAHQDYIQRGAQMLETNTYQATVKGFMKHWSISREEALALIKLGVTVCKEAVELEKEKGDSTRSISVLGTVGPYAVQLNDGSEYTGGRYIDSMSIEEMADWHKPKVEAMLEAGVDYLTFVTIPSLKEAEADILLLKQYPGTKAILSFSAQNEDTISHGERMSDVAQRCWELASDQILAIGVNCQHPRFSVPLLSSIKKANPQIPLAIKSNTTEVFDVTTKEWVVVDSDKLLTTYCQEWLKLGVQYIGGCCRTTVDDIANFRKAIDDFEGK